MQKQQPTQQIQLELRESEAEGIYSNLVMIGHSPSEMIFDFARFLPGTQKARVFARIIMTPQNAKSLLKTLEDNLKKYEEKFGEVKIQGMPEEKNIGFFHHDQP
jgi:formyltetrahydrofolate hydrolase